MKLKIILACTFLFFIFVPLVRADGMAFNTGYDFSSNALHGENVQIAAINYENGMEKLVIAVKMDQINDSSVIWIVPVPSKPENVKINVLKSFPLFDGYEIIKGARNKVNQFTNNVGFVVMLNQLWPIPMILFGTGFTSLASQGGVQVYAETQKEGITTQVVTAETSQGLYDYIRSKGVNVNSVSIPVIDEYIGKNYCFVVSWINAKTSKVNYNTPSIFVEFPTERIFYPLKPTSVYGERTIPVIIYIMGFAKPEFYDDIKSYARYKYFVRESGYVPENWPSEFYSKEEAGKLFYYTRMTIGYERSFGFEPDMINIPTPAASKFVDDLWMEKLEKVPPEIEAIIAKADLLDAISKNNFLPVVWIALMSMITGMIAGVIVFRDLRIIGYAILGLANCLTLLGVIAATYKFMKDESGKKKKAFIIVFMLLFLALNYAGLMVLSALILN
ncbi:MAG: hypothetical protein NTU57_00655 [Candidatus Aenigmarchaeota archaeon]|nr:hypothetical protein [Candidatus Aenigmarchaeota archaeon]